MNQRQCSGALQIFAGRVSEFSGRMVGNRNLMQTGVTMQIRGRASMVIGDAQRVIQSCMKRSQGLSVQ